jgi:SUKH-4 immunity protein
METELPDHVRDLFWRHASHVATGGPGTILGSDAGGTFVLDDQGAVQWEAHEAPRPGRFVSSSIGLFAEFLLTVSALRDELVRMPEADALRALSDTYERLRSRDPAAFAGNDTWWGVVFEQLRGGLL